MKPYTSLLRGVNETIDISTQGCQWNHIHLYSGVSMEPYIFLLRGVNETIHVSTQECQWKHTYLYSGVTMKPYISLLRGVNEISTQGCHETKHYSGVSIEPYTSLLRGVNGTMRIYSFTLTINDRKQISTDNTSLVSKILSVHCHIETMFIMILKPCWLWYWNHVQINLFLPHVQTQHSQQPWRRSWGWTPANGGRRWSRRGRYGVVLSVSRTRSRGSRTWGCSPSSLCSAAGFDPSPVSR